MNDSPASNSWHHHLSFSQVCSHVEHGHQVMKRPLFVMVVVSDIPTQRYQPIPKVVLLTSSLYQGLVQATTSTTSLTKGLCSLLELEEGLCGGHRLLPLPFPLKEEGILFNPLPVQLPLS